MLATFQTEADIHSVLGDYEQSWYKHLCAGSYVNINVLISPEYSPRSVFAGSHDKCMLKFIRNFLSKLFQCNCIPFCILSSKIWEFQMLLMLARMVLSIF